MRAVLLDALRRGVAAFALVAAIGIAVALAGLMLADPAISLGGVLRLGALYLGPFHGIPVVVEGDLALDLSRLPGSEIPTEGTLTVELGFALLAVTAFALWILFRAGRATGERAGGKAARRALAGGAVGIGYAVPVALVALVVRFQEGVTVGSFVSGELEIRLAWLPALLVPLALAVVAGAVGGAWSRIATGEPRVAAVLGGGWRMLWLGLGLSFAGLVVAGAVQPDEPVALLTPTTARYYGSAFERPGPGAVLFGHHLLASPNLATWALVPAMGGCTAVTGSDAERRELVCFTTARTGPDGAARDLPAGYLLFALAPAAATVMGGWWVARRAGVEGWRSVPLAALAGVVFAALVASTSVLAAITLSWEAVSAEAAGGAHLRIGPDVLGGFLVALAWGVVGGSVGAAGWALRRR